MGDLLWFPSNSAAPIRKDLEGFFEGVVFVVLQQYFVLCWLQMCLSKPGMQCGEGKGFISPSYSPSAVCLSGQRIMRDSILHHRTPTYQMYCLGNIIY